VPVQEVLKRDGRSVPFDAERVTLAIYKAAAAQGGHDRALSESLSAKVVALLGKAYPADQPPTVEEIQDVVERVLIHSGHARTAKAYILYRHDRERVRRWSESSRIEPIPYRTMWEQLDWNVERGCHTVAGLNEIVRNGKLPALIQESEARYESILDGAARAVVSRRENLRFVIVAGPSSSGKTTTMHKLSERLEAEGLHVIPMSLDNYFFNLECHPQDEFGDHDFETPEAMDLALINEHLASLDQGRGIDMPNYDFKTGLRLPETTRFNPGPDTVILLDTLHGLYGGLTASVPDEHKFRLYIETISQLKGEDGRYVRWTDIRLLRRMLRDSRHRGYSTEETILHWHFVRRSELKHIIPHQGSVDYVVNGSLPYELLYLKKYLFDQFPPFLEKWRGDDARTDAVIRAERTHALLDSLDNVDDESIVPDSSILREFIGGSRYSVH
jgi:uridine kinase